MGPSSGSLHIGAGARVHAKQVADVDKQRNLDHCASLQFGRLRAARGGVATEAGLGFDHLELHKGRKYNTDRSPSVEQDGNDQFFLEDAASLPDLLLL